MSRVLSQSDFAKITKPEDFQVYVSKWANEVTPVINGKLEFDQNLLTQTVSVVFATANVAQSVSSSLKNASKYIVCGKSVACDIYGSGSGGRFSLASTVPATVQLILF